MQLLYQLVATEDFDCNRPIYLVDCKRPIFGYLHCNICNITESSSATTVITVISFLQREKLIMQRESLESCMSIINGHVTTNSSWHVRMFVLDVRCRLIFYICLKIYRLRLRGNGSIPLFLNPFYIYTHCTLTNFYLSAHAHKFKRYLVSAQ